MGFDGDMPAFATAELSDAELADILTFLAAAPRPTTGDALFARFCANCHGADGGGGRVGKSLGGEADSVSSRVRRGHGGTSYGSRTQYMPAWSATDLSDAEVAEIEAYVAGLA